MADIVILLLVTLVVSVLLDGAVQPRRARVRRPLGLSLHVLVMTGVFGLFLTGAGNAVVAAVLGTAMIALFTVASNAKFRILGEPLIFSDLAMLAAVVRHPRFYFTAISVRQRWMLGVSAVLATAVLVSTVSPRLPVHLTGAALVLTAAAGLWLMLRSRWVAAAMLTPDLENDVVRYGLIATLLVYQRRWRETADPPALLPITMAHRDPPQPEVIIVVQCESFADPVALTGDERLELPGLAAARAQAWQQGELAVSGFGAYTMRSEYGVLFGRSEAALGFRRYDPFLSAHGETSYALAARLADYHATFVHPHDLRFYGRDRLMPAVGFERVIGEEAFAPVPPERGRYVDDRTLGAMLGDLVAAATQPTFLYTVTMENHGPWDSDRKAGSPGGLDSYLRHARSSDGMLSDLAERLAANGRPALLVFFGDHRPSIPGVSVPGGARHTPYVMLRFGHGGTPIGSGTRVDLTPADLHAAVLACVA